MGDRAAALDKLVNAIIAGGQQRAAATIAIMEPIQRGDKRSEEAFYDVLARLEQMAPSGVAADFVGDVLPDLPEHMQEAVIDGMEHTMRRQSEELDRGLAELQKEIGGPVKRFLRKWL